MSNHLRDKLHACAIEGLWWEPTGKPQVPADWIRELVVSGRIPGTDASVHAKGVRIRGVVLNGLLDFESAGLRVPLMLDEIETGEQIVFEQAAGSWVSVTNSRIAGISAYELSLEHSFDLCGTESAESIILARATIRGNVLLVGGFSALGEVSLWGASIGGQLSCEGGTIKNSGGIALNGDGVEVAKGVFLGGGFTAHGEVRLLGASVVGQLSCAGGAFVNEGAVALNADGVRITGNLLLDSGFAAHGEVRLVGASVGGQVSCDGGVFTNEGGRALSADQAEIGQSVFLGEGFRALGQVRLRGAAIGGQLSCVGGTFMNGDGSALDADSVRVAGDILLAGGFNARGAVTLSGAEIAGVLSCIGGSFVNPGSFALNADRASIGGDVALESRDEAGGRLVTGGGFASDGEISMMGIVVRGVLSCKGGTLRNVGGRALNVDGAEISRGMFLGRGFSARGEVRLLGASIGGQLACQGGTFINEGGYALNADGATIGRDVFMSQGFFARGKVRLSGASIGGQLSCVDGSFSAPREDGLSIQEATIAGAFLWRPRELAPETRIDLSAASIDLLADDLDRWPTKGLLHLDRFTYVGFAPESGADVEARIEWLRLSDGFRSQPYEQLALVYRSMGDSIKARAVGVAKERDRNKTLDRWSARWHKSWGVFTDYGYRPAKSLWFFAVCLVVAGTFFSWAGNSGVMEPTRPGSVASATECSKEYLCYQPVIYAADVMVPIIDLDQRDAWTADASMGGTDVMYWPWAAGGTLVRFVTVLFIAIGWMLTAAFIASASQAISRR